MSPKGNEGIAYELVNQLILQGVDYFCLAPGLRLTPFAVAIDAHPKAHLFTHFDERGVAFHALGYAKASGKPAAIVVTSGSALGNLYPAVMEASYAQVPLILLTSDRPPEMREVKANQTCDQVKFFGRHVRFTFDLPSAHAEFPPRFLATLVAQAVYRAKESGNSGPVQLNCPFPEPFLAHVPEGVATETPCIYEETKTTVSREGLARIAALLQKSRKGAIVVGTMPSGVDLTPLIQLAEKLRWPLLGDITSGLRSLGSPFPCIRYWQRLIVEDQGFAPECILHLGDQCVFKKLFQWRNKATSLVQVSLHAEPWDPSFQLTHRVICDPLSFCKELPAFVEEEKETAWIDLWLASAERVDQLMQAEFCQEEALSEIGLFRALMDSPHALFVANSMPIRDADRFFFPEKSTPPIFASRGLSGIDGNIATCAGIASQQPLVAIIGDLAALHDLNSLAMLKKSTHPLTLIVINNGGGGIFAFTAAHQKEKVREEILAGSHSYTFEQAAALFGIDYVCAKRKEELLPFLGKTALIELFTSREENFALHKALEEKISEALDQSCSLR